MANNRSAEKNIRKTKKRTALNRQRKEAIRTKRKSLATAIASGDSKAMGEELRLYTKALDTAASRNTIHKNKASRLKSRAALRIKKIESGGTLNVAAKKIAKKKVAKTAK